MGYKIESMAKIVANMRLVALLKVFENNHRHKNHYTSEAHYC